MAELRYVLKVGLLRIRKLSTLEIGLKDFVLVKVYNLDLEMFKYKIRA